MHVGHNEVSPSFAPLISCRHDITSAIGLLAHACSRRQSTIGAIPTGPPALLATAMDQHILKLCVENLDKMSQCSTRAPGSSCAKTMSGGSSTVGSSSTHGRSSIVVPELMSAEKSMAWKALTDYVGGMDGKWTRSDYERVFGEVGPASPFGSRVWEGLIKLTPFYRDNLQKTWLVGDGYVPWLGAFIMPNHFSLKMAQSPIDDRTESQPSDQLYPAVFYLDKAQHERVVAERLKKDDETALVVRSTNHLSLMKHKGENIDAVVHRHVWIAGDEIGCVYMVCLKIMISCSKLWSVHFDRVHLYTPISKL